MRDGCTGRVTRSAYTNWTPARRPEGSTTGLPRITGAFRVKNLSFGDPHDGIVTIAAQCESDDVVTIDTYP